MRHCDVINSSRIWRRVSPLLGHFKIKVLSKWNTFICRATKETKRERERERNWKSEIINAKFVLVSRLLDDLALLTIFGD